MEHLTRNCDCCDPSKQAPANSPGLAAAQASLNLAADVHQIQRNNIQSYSDQLREMGDQLQRQRQKQLMKETTPRPRRSRNPSIASSSSQMVIEDLTNQKEDLTKQNRLLKMQLQQEEARRKREVQLLLENQLGPIKEQQEIIASLVKELSLKQQQQQENLASQAEAAPLLDPPQPTQQVATAQPPHPPTPTGRRIHDLPPRTIFPKQEPDYKLPAPQHNYFTSTPYHGKPDPVEIMERENQEAILRDIAEIRRKQELSSIDEETESLADGYSHLRRRRPVRPMKRPEAAPPTTLMEPSSTNSRKTGSSDIGKEFLKVVPKFNGKDKKQFLEWIMRIESAAQQIGDPVAYPPSTIALLKAEGSVYSTMMNFPKDKNWDEIKRELTAQYSTIPTGAHGIMALQRREQEYDETLEEYTNDYYRLLKIVKKETPTTCKDKVSIVNYCKGILNQQVREKACKHIHDFATLLDAAIYARDQEAKTRQKEVILKGTGDRDHPISLFEVSQDQSTFPQRLVPKTDRDPMYQPDQLIYYAKRFIDATCFECQTVGHTRDRCKDKYFLQQVEAVRQTLGLGTGATLDVKHNLEVITPVQASTIGRMLKQMVDPALLRNKAEQDSSAARPSKSPRQYNSTRPDSRSPSGASRSPGNRQPSRSAAKPTPRSTTKPSDPRNDKRDKRVRFQDSKGKDSRSKDSKPRGKPPPKKVQVMDAEEEEDIFYDSDYSTVQEIGYSESEVEWQSGSDTEPSEVDFSEEEDAPSINCLNQVYSLGAEATKKRIPKHSLFHGKVNGSKTSVLYDTGADLSCLSFKFFKTLHPQPQLQPPITRINTASGTPLKVNGLATCSLTLGGKTMDHTFTVIEDITTPVIIGTDLQKAHGMGQYWKDNRMYITVEKPRIMKIGAMAKSPISIRLKVSEETTIPARSICNLSTTPEGPIERLEPGYLKVNENFQSVGQLTAVTSYHHLPANKKGHPESFPAQVPFPIINHQEYSITLKPNTIVATLTPTQDRILRRPMKKDQGSYIMKLSSAAENRKNADKRKRKEAQEKAEMARQNRQLAKERTKKPSPSREQKQKAMKDSSMLISPSQKDKPDKPDLKDYKTSKATQTAFAELCKEYDHLFSKDQTDIGCTPLLQMNIDTGDSPPIAQPPYKTALKHVDWLKEELAKLEAAGIIEACVSPWASPVVIVPKKRTPGLEPERRMCVDYRALNKLSTKPKSPGPHQGGILTYVPLPRIDDLFGMLDGASIFSSLDLTSGYHHIELDQESKDKAAFVTQFGKFRFHRVPFGLAQAPAYFQHLMYMILRGLSFTFAYMDDILVFSKSEQDHLQHLRQVFQRLHKADLKMKKKKCDFFKEELHYLGHLISTQGIAPRADKLEAIQQMTPPTNQTQTRSFLGLTGYYAKFVPHYQTLVKPMTKRTRSTRPFLWDEAAEKAFQELKKALMTPPILIYPNPQKHYVLYTDASKHAWGAVLMQHADKDPEPAPQDPTTKPIAVLKPVDSKEPTLFPVVYLSKQFHGSQKYWPALVKEAYAVYQAVKKLTFYITGSLVQLRCDHLPLARFLERNTGSEKVNHWSLEIADMNIQFNYVPGKKNALADALSRMVDLGIAKPQKPEKEGYEYGMYTLPQTPEEAEARHKQDLKLKKQELQERREKTERKLAKETQKRPKTSRRTAVQEEGHQAHHPFVDLTEDPEEEDPELMKLEADSTPEISAITKEELSKEMKAELQALEPPSATPLDQ